MKQTHERSIRIGLLGLLCSHFDLALAHDGHDKLTHFSEGLWHPWLGVDHLLTAFAIGLLARLVSSGMKGFVPLCFVLAMAVGFYWPQNSAVLAYFEIGISVCLVGIAWLLNTRGNKSLFALMPILFVAGFCHGATHASGFIDDTMQTVAFAGLIMATFLIQVLGIIAGRYAYRWPRLNYMTGFACWVAVILPV